MKDNKTPKIMPTSQLFLKGSIIAIFLTVPSLTAFGISWYFTNDLFTAAIIGGIVHFFGLGLSFKISKKLFIQKSS